MAAKIASINKGEPMETKPKQATNAHILQAFPVRTRTFPASTTVAQPLFPISKLHLLGGYTPIEKTEEARKPDMSTGKCHTLTRAFMNYLNSDESSYEMREAEALKDSGYTAQDILELSKYMAGLQHIDGFEWRSGLFLSKLISQSNEKKFTIDTSGWKVLPEKIGFRCKEKHICVIGSVGKKPAQEMDGGVLYISGDAGDALAHHMRRGIVIVRGDVLAGDLHDGLGHSIGNGSIKIKVYGQVQKASEEVICLDTNATPKVYVPKPEYDDRGWGGGLTLI